MGRVIVAGPSEDVWRVRVEWMPRWHGLVLRFGGWRRTRRGDDGLLDAADAIPPPSGSGLDADPGFLDALTDEFLVGIALVVGFVVTVGLLWWVVIPLALLVADGLLVALLLVAGTVGRLLLRRPWTVRATSAGRPDRVTQVIGWRQARRTRDEMAASIRSGSGQ